MLHDNLITTHLTLKKTKKNVVYHYRQAALNIFYDRRTVLVEVNIRFSGAISLSLSKVSGRHLCAKHQQSLSTSTGAL